MDHINFFLTCHKDMLLLRIYLFITRGNYKKQYKNNKGPYIKYVGGASQTVFVGIMKYFRHILMGHEIFFKIFDEPQNIFLCSIFVILFRGVAAQNIQTSNQRNLRKTKQVK